MKIGWLVWQYEDDKTPIFIAGAEGDHRLDYCYRKVQIVYAEVVND